MPFQQGRAKTGGRKVGVANRLTGTFRDAVQIAYNEAGGHEAFTEWAKKNRTEFYKIASRLIPVEIRDTTDKTINVVIRDFRKEGPSADPQVIDAQPAIEHRETPKDVTGF